MLQVRNLVTCYGSLPALHGISFEVKRGEIVALVGANGAGKTTTLLTLSGVLPVSAGEILLETVSIVGRAPHEIVRLGLAQVPEGRQIFGRLTVIENLIAGAYIRSDRRGVAEDVARVMERFPRLAERSRQLAGTLSGGEQQMLAIARALMTRPSLLLLDEPSMGLAPLIVEAVFRLIEEINRDGTTILLVEQNARQSLAISHRAYVLAMGRIAKTGTGAALLEDPEIQQAYLGRNRTAL